MVGGAHSGMAIAGLPGVNVHQVAETRRVAGGGRKPPLDQPPDLLPAGESTAPPLPRERKNFSHDYLAASANSTRASFSQYPRHSHAVFGHLF